jgi:cobalt-zinc-cadmium efflux system outer membrane protein
MLVAAQVPAPLEWRLDAGADRDARQRAEAMLVGGLTLEEAIHVAFLASPELQVELEKLEISRAEFVAATAAPNPVVVVGSRQPNGSLSSFYPDRTISVGVLESVIDLIKMPGRRAAARRDLQRARYEAANSAVRLAAEVAQAWIDYSAALQLSALREQSSAIRIVAYENMRAARDAGNEVSEDAIESERMDLLSENADGIRARLEVARTRADLAQRLGITAWRDDWTVAVGLPVLPDADPDPAAVEQSALARRLDLLAANETIEARLRVLANQRRFGWLNQLDLGVFREQVTGGTTFTGPTVVVEVPVFNQRFAELLEADARLRTEYRNLEVAQLSARAEIRRHAAEMAAARQLDEQLEREILPSQRRRQAAPAGGDPDDPGRLGQRLDLISSESARIVCLRDYWRARSAMSLAAGDWDALGALR